MDLGLLQKDVAKHLGCTTSNLFLWEKDRHWPGCQWWPRIICFLGYDPVPTSEDIPSQLKALRRRRGISQKELASLLEIDPATMRKWELDKGVPIDWRGAELKEMFGQVGITWTDDPSQ